MRQGRKRAFGDPLFLLRQKKWAKRGAGYGSDCTAMPQNHPAEEHCGQHTINCLQIWTTRRLRGTTLPSIAVAAQGGGKTRCCGMQNASTNSPMVQNIYVLLQIFVGADAYIGSYRPVSNIGTISYRENSNSAPDRAFRPRSSQKFARVSAQYNASPAPLFAYFFWRNRKSRPAERQLQCNCKRGSLVKPDKRADRVVRPYKPLCKTPLVAQLRCHRKEGSSGETGQKVRA